MKIHYNFKTIKIHHLREQTIFNALNEYWKNTNDELKETIGGLVYDEKGKLTNYGRQLASERESARVILEQLESARG